MVQLTEEDIIALKGLASVAPQLEAILGAPKPRTDSDEYETDNDRLTRQISGSTHVDKLHERIGNAWQGKK